MSYEASGDLLNPCMMVQAKTSLDWPRYCTDHLYYIGYDLSPIVRVGSRLLGFWRIPKPEAPPSSPTESFQPGCDPWLVVIVR